ncbi:Uncharacterised protein [uncultured archaeon]|nr:Uncharacterised protein [uncultured archaeon]
MNNFYEKTLALKNSTRMTRIGRIFTDNLCASVSSVQSVFYRNCVSAFICVHLRLIFEMLNSAEYGAKGRDAL